MSTSTTKNFLMVQYEVNSSVWMTTIMGMTMITAIGWAAARLTGLEIQSWCFAAQKRTRPSS
jgi:hypothetical protein